MPAEPSTPILHQYEISPFSERVRVGLGIKGLAWRPCDQPNVNPKPELVALTGGFRRIPVLQIGADLYFDSLAIMEELDRRFPERPLFNAGLGLSHAVHAWADGPLFQAVVGLLFADDWSYDDAFLADRSALLGRPFDPAEMRAAAPGLRLAFQGHLASIEAQLRDGRSYLTGDLPDAIDAQVYTHIVFCRWGLGATARLIEDFPRLLRWAERVQAIGHGQRGRALDRAEAIAIARSTQPAEVEPAARPGEPEPGTHILYRYADANSPLLDGTLLRIDLKGLVIARDSQDGLHVNLHIPHALGTIVR